MSAATDDNDTMPAIPSAMLMDALRMQKFRHAGLLQALGDWYRENAVVYHLGMLPADDQALMDAIDRVVASDAPPTLSEDARDPGDVQDVAP